MKKKKILKQIVSGVLSLTMLSSILPSIPTDAADTSFMYPYTNVGTYNYCSYEKKIPGHDKPEDKRLHSILDVLPYRDDGGNRGNVSGLIYGNSTSARQNNGNYHATHVIKNLEAENKEEREKDIVFYYYEEEYWYED